MTYEERIKIIFKKCYEGKTDPCKDYYPEDLESDFWELFEDDYDKYVKEITKHE